MTPPPIRWVPTLALVVTLTLIQVTVADRVEVAEALRVDLPILVAVVIALRARTDDAVVVGFVAGVLVDLFDLGPFGQHALIATLLTFTISAGRVRLTAAHRARLARPTAVVDPSGRPPLVDAAVRSAVAAAGMAVAAAGPVLVGAAVAGAPPSPEAVVTTADLSAVVAAAVVVHPITALVAMVGATPGGIGAARPYPGARRGASSPAGPRRSGRPAVTPRRVLRRVDGGLR